MAEWSWRKVLAAAAVWGFLCGATSAVVREVLDDDPAPQCVVKVNDEFRGGPCDLVLPRAQEDPA